MNVQVQINKSEFWVPMMVWPMGLGMNITDDAVLNKV